MSEQLRNLLAKLEQVNPGDRDAVATVHSWLSYAADDPDSLTAEFAIGFPYAEKIAKAAGDLELMRRITDACLIAVRGSTPRLRWELGLEARVLICGAGWHLQRTHQLESALNHTQRGVEIAQGITARHTEAFGKKCLGRLERLIAEGSRIPNNESERRLETSVELLQNARRMFFGIEGSDSAEAGDCFSLEGRTWLVRHRISPSTSLVHAIDCAREARRLIPADNSKDYWDLVILEAEIKLAENEPAVALKIIDDTISHLSARSDGSNRSEIVARALCCRASILGRWHPRSGIAPAIEDLRRAEAIYADLNQVYLAAECRWRQLILDPNIAATAYLDRQELDELERAEPNVQVRLIALQELDEILQNRDHRLVGRRSRVDWTPILKRARLRNLRD